MPYDPDREGDDLLVITTGGIAEPAAPEPWPDEPWYDDAPIIEPPVVDDPASHWPIPLDEQPLYLPTSSLDPWSQPIEARNIVGPFDGWIGKVLQVYDSAVHPLLQEYQAVEVVRVDMDWDTNNEPAPFVIPMAGGNPTSHRVVALPYPPRHDQQKYLVAVGDTVAVISGRDGRHWYFIDDEPFPAVVTSAVGASTKEANSGGAGNYFLTVKRQAIAGDPTSGSQSLSDLQTAAAADVTISYVYPIMQGNQTHGYRVGDTVWVQKRGRYYFAVPSREGFLAYTVSAGPEAEADHADAVYWVREVTPIVGWTDNDYTITYGDTDRTASDGKQGRWVPATNLAELPSGTHLVATGTAGSQNGVFVWCYLMGDAQGDPHYVFYHKPLRFIKGGTTANEVTKVTFVDGTGATITLTDNGNGAVTVTVAAAAHNLLGTLHTDTTAGNPVQGDIIYADATPKWTKLPIGSTDDVLHVSGGLPAWGAINFANGVGIDAFANVWADVNADGTYTLSSDDWRGRYVMGSANASAESTTPATRRTENGVGDNTFNGFIGDSIGSDLVIAQYYDHSGWLQLKVRSADGHIVFYRPSGWGTAGGGRVQFHLYIIGGTQKTAADISAPDAP